MLRGPTTPQLSTSGAARLVTASFLPRPSAAGAAGLVAFSGELDRVGVEGTGAYGVGLQCQFRTAGVAVVEVDRPNRQTRAALGKSDPLDAYAAGARLSGQADLREELRHPSTPALIATCARLCAPGALRDCTQATKVALRQPARRHQRLTAPRGADSGLKKDS